MSRRRRNVECDARSVRQNRLRRSIGLKCTIEFPGNPIRVICGRVTAGDTFGLADAHLECDGGEIEPLRDGDDWKFAPGQFDPSVQRTADGKVLIPNSPAALAFLSFFSRMLEKYGRDD